MNHAVVSLSVPATVSGVRQAIVAFERFAQSHALAAGTSWRGGLALDEILSNIVRHHVPGARVAIDMTFSLDGDTVAMEILDGTPPFNPLLAPAPDITIPLEQRQPGGLGIALVRSLMDDIGYEHRDRGNYIVMKCRPRADR